MVAIWRMNRHLKSNYTLPCIFISTKSEISCSSALPPVLLLSLDIPIYLCLLFKDKDGGN